MSRTICASLLTALAFGIVFAGPEPPPPSWAVYSVAFSADGKRLAAVDSMGRVTAWSISPVPVGPGPNVGLWTEPVFKGGTREVGFGKDGKELFVVNGEGAVKVLAAGSGKELRSLPKIGNTGSAVFLPDGKHLITS